MSLIVQKYGGTSVKGIDRIRNVAQRVAADYDAGNDMVVVLSAMSGETDRLINLAKEITENPDPREMDQLVSTGEQVTVSLLAIMLESMGKRAVSLLGSQVKVLTDSNYMGARVVDVDPLRIRALLKEKNIVIVAGFQGCDMRGNVTTLGRGGSDTSAVALAAALESDLCEIYTDVDGVYTADPGVVPRARKLPVITYEEMMEMAGLGAKVLHLRSVEFAMKYNIPLCVRSSFSNEPGTMVVGEGRDMENLLVSGVTVAKNDARITITKVPDRPGIASRVFSAVGDAGISVDMIIQNTRAGGLTDITFTVPKGDFKRALEIEKKVAEELGAENVAGDAEIAKVSVIGVGMKSNPGVAAKMFAVLARENINIMMISTSEIRISCVIEKKYAELAMRVLHSAFGLDAEEI
jgi:aspartate kinase